METNKNNIFYFCDKCIYIDKWMIDEPCCYCEEGSEIIKEFETEYNKEEGI